ncbi:MAG TPA: tetratricopeptide repeat protein [Pyrinomonadaceae bacterium]
MPKQLKVMISSTSHDLPKHREQVREACLQQGMFPIMMEQLPASDAEAIPASLKLVDQADIYLLILAHRYGYVPLSDNPAQISVTEHEYNHALERRIPSLTFAMHEDHPLRAEDVETGAGADKLKALKTRALVKGTNFFRSPEDLRGHVVNSLSKFVTFQSESGPQPLIHSLPTQQEIEGRESECVDVLGAMSGGEHQVYVFTAPGGFGKTALLAKVVRMLSPDDLTLLDKIKLPDGKTIEPHASSLLHIDCRKEVKISELFTNAGRLIGAQQTFEAIYNGDGELADKLQEIFRRLSADNSERVWVAFDNFESMLNERGEVSEGDLRAFFSAVFVGGHRVRALIVGREVPKFSRRERPEVLEAVGESLFEGLPINDCIEYLKKNEGARGLSGSTKEVDAVLQEFANRVHRIPLALVWAAGYLEQTSYTLAEILKRTDLFADFDKDQGKDADRYENKGLKRLHYEQLKIQPVECLPILHLLAFFKRPVPRGVLAHLMDEIELSKTLTRLERNRLITHKQSADAHTRFINDPLAVNLYGLHPVICENEFFDAFADQDRLFEAAAGACRKASSAAYKVNRFGYLLELADCAEKVYEYLTKELGRIDLLDSHAAMLTFKGLALWGLNKLNEALVEYDKAIQICEHLVNTEKQTDFANDLAMAYMNKGIALTNLTKLDEALVEYDKAIAIRERLVNEEQQAWRANQLAMAYLNKGAALWQLKKSDQALVEYDKALAIRERLVNEEQQTDLAEDLAMVYMNKGIALWEIGKLDAALVEYEKGIAIRERLVTEEQQTHLANQLAKAYMNRGIVLVDLMKLDAGLLEYDKAIEIYERLINDEQQMHLVDGLASVYSNKGLTLERQGDFEEAMIFYEKSVSVRSVCVDELNMYWLMPDLLKVLRYQLTIRLMLQRWPATAEDVRQFLSRFDLYLKNDSIDPSLKKATQQERVYLGAELRKMSPEQLELLYGELGDEAKVVKSLIEDNENSVSPS